MLWLPQETATEDRSWASVRVEARCSQVSILPVQRLPDCGWRALGQEELDLPVPKPARSEATTGADRHRQAARFLAKLVAGDHGSHVPRFAEALTVVNTDSREGAYAAISRGLPLGGDRRVDLTVGYGHAAPKPRSLRRPVCDVIINA